ncbi:MAG: response regulator [Cyanobacteria bacterium J06621_12]
MPIKTRRILLINCDRAIEEMMQLCLETISDCRVIVVNSGFEAIEKAATKQIDAILLDLDGQMPDLSWSILIKAFSQNPLTSSIPLVLLTSAPQSQEVVRLQQTREIRDTSTASFVIVKSFDLLSLTQQISTVLNWTE